MAKGAGSAGSLLSESSPQSTAYLHTNPLRLDAQYPNKKLKRAPEPSAVHSTYASEEEELIALRKEVKRLRNSKAKHEKAGKLKEKQLASMRKSKSSSDHTFVDDSMDPAAREAAKGFWIYTVKPSAGKNKGSGTSWKQRQAVLIELVRKSYGGEVWNQIKKIVREDLKFNKLKIAHTMDMNVNVNYTILDTFRGMETGLKPSGRGIICSSSTVKRIHAEVYKPVVEILGCSFPEEYSGSVWTCNAPLALLAYFKDFYLSSGIHAPASDPWIVTFTGDGLRVGFAGCFAAGMKKVSAGVYAYLSLRFLNADVALFVGVALLLAYMRVCVGVSLCVCVYVFMCLLCVRAPHRLHRLIGDWHHSKLQAGQ